AAILSEQDHVAADAMPEAENSSEFLVWVHGDHDGPRRGIRPVQLKPATNIGIALLVGRVAGGFADLQRVIVFASQVIVQPLPVEAAPGRGVLVGDKSYPPLAVDDHHLENAVG